MWNQNEYIDNFKNIKILLNTYHENLIIIDSKVNNIVVSITKRAYKQNTKN